MKNKRIHSKLFILCIFLFLLASCANLPGKESSKNQRNGSENTNVQSVQQPDVPESQPGMISRQEAWTAPSAEGPTVTPVVLFVEKRGKDAAMIIRTNTESSEDVYIYDSSGSVSGISVPTQSVPVSGALRDEMKVYSFSPVNGAVVLPNQFLHLDMMLQNTGTTTWQTNYKVKDISSSPITVQREYSLPYAVGPNGTVLLSVFMTAPEQLGTYYYSFQIEDAYGVAFGKIDYSLTVGAFSSITEIPTLTATVTPTYYSADGITATPDSLAWMCIDPERSKLQDCYQFCVEYSDRPEFRYCFYDGERYLTPVPEIVQEEE